MGIKLIDENVNIEKIRESIKLDMRENIDVYTQTLKKECQEILDAEKLNSLLDKEISSSYGNIERFKNEYGIVMKNKVPYGNVLAIYNGDFFVTIELMLKTISTRNVLKIKPSQLQITNLILFERINKILEEYGIADKLELITDETIENVDLILQIGDDYNFNIKIPKDIPIKKIEYKKSILYVEDVLDKELLEKIKENYAYVIVKDGIDIEEAYDKKVKDVEEAVKYINKDYKRVSVGIMCKKPEVSGYFIQKVYATNVFVNVSPTLIEEFDLECEELLYQKNICVYRN